MEDTILYTSCFDANGGLFETILTADEYNITNTFKQRLEHAAKLLESEQVNIKRMSASVDSVLALKDLNGASAEAALKLYEKAVAGAEGTLTVIETIAGT